jgi:hypothetical protein
MSTITLARSAPKPGKSTHGIGSSSPHRSLRPLSQRPPPSRLPGSGHRQLPQRPQPEWAMAAAHGRRGWGTGPAGGGGRHSSPIDGSGPGLGWAGACPVPPQRSVPGDLRGLAGLRPCLSLRLHAGGDSSRRWGLSRHLPPWTARRPFPSGLATAPAADPFLLAGPLPWSAARTERGRPRSLAGRWLFCLSAGLCGGRWRAGGKRDHPWR